MTAIGGGPSSSPYSVCAYADVCRKFGTSLRDLGLGLLLSLLSSLCSRAYESKYLHLRATNARLFLAELWPAWGKPSLPHGCIQGDTQWSAPYAVYFVSSCIAHVAVDASLHETLAEAFVFRSYSLRLFRPWKDSRVILFSCVRSLLAYFCFIGAQGSLYVKFLTRE